jgi:hypothetical protein
MVLLFLLLLLLSGQAAQAHVPVVPEGNWNLSGAFPISDPAKSWAVYGDLEAGKASYHSFEIEKGQRISLSLLASTDPREEGFAPSMALLGPGLKHEGELPGFVELPAGYGAVSIKGVRPEEATYEPFGPSSYYHLADLDIEAPASGIYYVAVYDPMRGGHYGLAVGYLESFTLEEMVATPVRLISVYQWEGQSLPLVLMPFLIAVVIGFLLRRRARLTPFFLAATLAGMLFIGSGLSILVQTALSLSRAPPGPEVLISLALAAVPTLLGALALRASRSGRPRARERAAMILLGIVALPLGAGLILGPASAVAAGILPSAS